MQERLEMILIKSINKAAYFGDQQEREAKKLGREIIRVRSRIGPGFKRSLAIALQLPKCTAFKSQGEDRRETFCSPFIMDCSNWGSCQYDILQVEGTGLEHFGAR